MRFSRRRRVARLARGALALLLAPALGCALRNPAHHPAERLLDDLERSRARPDSHAPAIAATGSLWTDAAAVSLVGDTRAARAGDLVTVHVLEDTKGSQQATTDLAKDGTLSLATPVLGGYEARLTNKFPNFNPAQVLDTSTQKSFKGDGATSRETSVVAAVTARVIGVYPNGAMAIVGQKDVEVNHERQVLTLVGIVRAEDLGPNNVVSSDRLAELAVHLGGRGDINNAQREGWLSRLIQRVWPF